MSSVVSWSSASDTSTVSSFQDELEASAHLVDLEEPMTSSFKSAKIPVATGVTREPFNRSFSGPTSFVPCAMAEQPTKDHTCSIFSRRGDGGLEQPSNPAKSISLQNAPPERESRKDKRSFCGFLIFRLCCALLAIIALSVGAGIFIDRLMTDDEDCHGAIIPATAATAGTEVTSGSMEAPAKPSAAEETLAPCRSTEAPTDATSSGYAPTDSSVTVKSLVATRSQGVTHDAAGKCGCPGCRSCGHSDTIPPQTDQTAPVDSAPVWDVPPPCETVPPFWDESFPLPDSMPPCDYPDQIGTLPPAGVGHGDQGFPVESNPPDMKPPSWIYPPELDESPAGGFPWDETMPPCSTEVVLRFDQYGKCGCPGCRACGHSDTIPPAAGTTPVDQSGDFIVVCPPGMETGTLPDGNAPPFWGYPEMESTSYPTWHYETVIPTPNPTSLPTPAPTMHITSTPPGDTVALPDTEAPSRGVPESDPLPELPDGCSNSMWRTSHGHTSPETAMDLGLYGGSASCRLDYVTCQPVDWVGFAGYRGVGTQWFKARAGENSVCESDVEHRVHLTVPEGVNYDLRIYQDMNTTTPREAYLSSHNNVTGMDELLIVSSKDVPLDSLECFDYYIKVEYRSGDSCAAWTLDVFGHDCF